MAAKCINCPEYRQQKKTASVHGKQARIEGWGHEYQHLRLPPMGTSETFNEYQQSDAHKASYARAGAFCLAAQAGCPEPCLGEPTKHHVLAVSAAGNRAKAEEWPVITLCAHHNEWVEHAGRSWAKHTTFERDGREYAFRLTAADVRGLVPPYAGVTQ